MHECSDVRDGPLVPLSHVRGRGRLDARVAPETAHALLPRRGVGAAVAVDVAPALHGRVWQQVPEERREPGVPGRRT